MIDIVEQLRDRAYSGLPDPLLAEAADEIVRLRNGAVSGRETVRAVTEPLPVAVSGRGSVTPVSYEKSDEKRVLYDTKSPRNGALSGCETVPDPDSRVWETPRTPQPHATPAQGGVRGDGSVPCSRPGNDPAAWAVTMGDGSVYEAFAAHQYDEAVALARKCLFGSDLPLPLEPLYRQPTLTDVARESLAAMACYFDSRSDLQMQAWGSLLRGLLERLA